MCKRAYGGKPVVVRRDLRATLTEARSASDPAAG
jgi:hypothetical protein